MDPIAQSGWCAFHAVALCAEDTAAAVRVQA